MYAYICCRKMNTDNLVREEMEMRRKEREAAKQARDKEEQEEKKKERQKEDTRDQMSQMIQLHILKSISGSGGTVNQNVLPPQSTGVAAVPQKLEVNLKLKEDDDSETFPLKIFIETFDELVNKLRDFCGVEPSKPVKVILLHTNRILDLDQISNGKTYLVDFKEKEDSARIYMD